MRGEGAEDDALRAPLTASVVSDATFGGGGGGRSGAPLNLCREAGTSMPLRLVGVLGTRSARLLELRLVFAVMGLFVAEVDALALLNAMLPCLECDMPVTFFIDDFEAVLACLCGSPNVLDCDLGKAGSPVGRGSSGTIPFREGRGSNMVVKVRPSDSLRDGGVGAVYSGASMISALSRGGADRGGEDGADMASW